MKNNTQSLRRKMKQVTQTTRRNDAKKASIMKLVDSMKPPIPADAEEKYLAHLGIPAPSKALRRSRRVAFEKLMRRIRKTMRTPKPKRIIGHRKPLPLDPNVPAKFPFCFSSATDCLVDGRNSCVASEALLKLNNSSNGLGGTYGIGAIPNIPSVTGSLFYTVEVPSDGMLTAIAEVSFTGIISCRSDLFWQWGDEMPTIYGQARLTLRVLVHQSVTAKQDMLIQEVHSKPYPGEVSTFNDDIYVLIMKTPVLGPTVVVEVQADLWAFGRSDYGYAQLDFASDNFGIRVPAMCFSFVPFSPPL